MLYVIILRFNETKSAEYGNMNVGVASWVADCYLLMNDMQEPVIDIDGYKFMRSG